MANTSAVYARIDNDLKENAEGILAQLGITPSSAIQMLYRQIVLQNGLPFDAKLPTPKPLAMGAMTKEQLDAEITKGYNEMLEGKGRAAEEVFADIRKENGL